MRSIKHNMICLLYTSEILDRHAPIISALGKGTVSITDAKGQKHKFDIKKGFLEVIQNEVSLLVRV